MCRTLFLFYCLLTVEISINRPMPVPKPAKASQKPAFANVPLATRPPNFPGPYQPQVPHSQYPTGNSIQIPSNRDIVPTQLPEATPVWETFNLQDEGHIYDPRTSAADAEKALRQLVEDSHNDKGDEEIDMSQALVDGFRDGIVLMPHQVLGRAWMKERETGKKTGGILADDMG